MPTMFGFPFASKVARGEGLVFVRLSCSTSRDVEPLSPLVKEHLLLDDIPQRASLILQDARFTNVCCYSVFAPRTGEWVRVKDVTLQGKAGASAQLAALLATIAGVRATRPGFTDAGDIWATGGVTAAGNIEAVTSDLFLKKIRLFADAPSTHRVFICPIKNWQQLSKSDRAKFLSAPAKLHPCRVSELAGLAEDLDDCLARRLVVLVGEWEMDALLHALFAAQPPLSVHERDPRGVTAAPWASTAMGIAAPPRGA